MNASMVRARTTNTRSRLVLLIIAAVLFAVILFGVVSTSEAQAATTYSDEEVAFVDLINDYRASKGLSTLLVSDDVSDACYRHNHDMAKYAFFDHYSLKSDWFATNATPWDRMAATGYDYYTSKGENIAAGQQTAQAVFDAWKASSGHNANMLGADFNVIGINRYELAGSPYTFYWTTDFGGYVDATAHTLTPTVGGPATTRYEQNSTKVSYSGVWSNSTSSYDSGGSYTYVNGTASVTVKFTGTYLAYVTKKGTAYGYAKITLDGGTPVTVDLYNGSTLYQQKVWNTGILADGDHTVKIEWAGVRRSAATACNIGVDAFDIAGSLDQSEVVVTPTTKAYEQNDSHLDYSGTWYTYTTRSASGGNYTRANTSTASVTVRFDGTYLKWIATAGTTTGKAYVSVDDGTPQLVDLARTVAAYKQEVWNTGVLASGVHTVKIWWYPGNIAGKYIDVDRFDVAGTLLDPTTAVASETTRYEQTDSHIIYSGTWYTYTTRSASGGNYTRANTSTASVTVRFDGTYLKWIATAGTTTGKAYVSVDDGTPQLVDLARTVAAYKQEVWNTGVLASGVHTVKIWWYPGNIAGKYIDVDRFDVAGTLLDPTTAVASETTRYEQTDSHIIYSGTWYTYTTSSASAKSYTRSSTTGASATVKFTGTRLTWIATAGTTTGKAFVSLDGGPAVSVNLARTTVAYQQSVWDSGAVENGSHTVKIWRDPSNIAGKYIDVDAFLVEGTLN